MKHAKDFVDHLEKFIELKVKDMELNDISSYTVFLDKKLEFIRFLDKLYFKTREK